MRTLQTREIAFHNFSPCIVNDQSTDSPWSLLNAGAYGAKSTLEREGQHWAEALGKYYNWRLQDSRGLGYHKVTPDVAVVFQMMETRF